MTTTEPAAGEKPAAAPKLAKVSHRRSGPRDADRLGGFLRGIPLQRLRGIGLVLLVLGMTGGGLLYWRHLELFPSTDDAYVSANIVKVAPQLGGSVTRVYFDPNQLVRQGDPLFDIDAARYDIELEKAHAQFDDAAGAAGDRGNAVSEAADALIDRRKEVDEARTEFFAAREQVKAGEEDTPSLDALSEKVRSAEAAFQAALDKLSQEIDGLGNGRQQTPLRLAAAAVQRAELERAHTRVSAPVQGWVSGGDLLAGALVQTGRPVFSLIDRDNWWVDAHFKETDLGRIRPGQAATISIDMYPDMEIKGTIGSISAGSGATFSMLPPENATGNWVKVSQRFTVRVNLTDVPDTAAKPLRAGASAHVTVDTAEGAGLISAFAGTLTGKK